MSATIKQRDQVIELLEQRIDDLKDYSHADDLITGLDTKHCSHARAAVSDRQGEDAPPEEVHTLEQQVVQFLSSKKIHLGRQQISVTFSYARIENQAHD